MRLSIRINTSTAPESLGAVASVLCAIAADILKGKPLTTRRLFARARGESFGMVKVEVIES